MQHLVCMAIPQAHNTKSITMNAFPRPRDFALHRRALYQIARIPNHHSHDITRSTVVLLGYIGMHGTSPELPPVDKV